MSSPLSPASPASSIADALSFSILSSVCTHSNSDSGTGVHFSDLGSTSPRSQALSDDEDFVLIPTGSNALSPVTPRTLPTPVREPVPAVGDSSSEEEDAASSDDTATSSESEEEDIILAGAMAALGISPPASAPAAPAQPTPANFATQRRRERQQRQRARRAARHTASESDESSGHESASSSSTASGDAYFSSQMYEEAVAFVSKYLNAPPQNPSAADRLHFLQSLIIELGLLANGRMELPTSVKTAKRVLAEQVHLNVKQYLAWRARRVAAYNMLPAIPQGRHNRQQAAEAAAKRQAEVQIGIADLQKVMYPSKSALRKSLKGTSSSASGTTGKMPLKLIKQAGLNCFLVTVF